MEKQTIITIILGVIAALGSTGSVGGYLKIDQQASGIEMMSAALKTQADAYSQQLDSLRVDNRKCIREWTQCLESH